MVLSQLRQPKRKTKNGMKRSMIFYVTKNDIWNGLKINYYVACLKESNNFIWNKKIVYFYNVSRLIIVSFFINSSSRILNWSISFCRCMLSSKHGIVIILNLGNFIFPQFWPEIVEGSILNLAILSNKKIWKILYLPNLIMFVWQNSNGTNCSHQ